MSLAVSDQPDLLAGALRRVMEVFDDELRSDLDAVRRLTDQTREYRGKLLRPRLVLLAGQAAGDLRDEHIVLAAVVEMVHVATLVHDDVLDEAHVRRSRPTVNRLAGNEAAVLLGDYLISHAYHLCSSLGSTGVARRVAAATNTVCEGELMQIAHRGDYDLTEAAYLEILRRKTAALTAASCELGAQLAGGPPPVVRHLSAFGMDLGIAFQIVDDLLDLTGSEEQTGKSVGRDANLGELTLPAIRFLQRANGVERQRLIDALSTTTQDRTRTIREVLADSDSVDYAVGVARSFTHSALSHLDLLPPSGAREALAAAARAVLRRNR
jgi:octaprenyl-diphosphate synthase